jgi:hypothetical protein
MPHAFPEGQSRAAHPCARRLCPSGNLDQGAGIRSALFLYPLLSAFIRMHPWLMAFLEIKLDILGDQVPFSRENDVWL